jgi:hypothetical protein
MAGERANVVFADPLHNIPIAGPVLRHGDVRASSASDAISEEFIECLQGPFAHFAGNVVDGAVIYLSMGWDRLEESLAAARPYFGKPKDMVVWVTAKRGQSALYRCQHHHIAVYRAGNPPPTSKIRNGERGRTNVWSYPGYKLFCQGWDTVVSVDRRVKPVALVADALRDSSWRGQIVLDPFAGIGTTMIAAERTRQRARLIEIDPTYCDLIVRRWQKCSGQNAHLAGSNESFAEVQARRHRADASQE